MATNFSTVISTGSFQNGDAVRIYKYIGSPARLDAVGLVNEATLGNPNFPNPQLCPGDIVVVGCEPSSVNATQTNQAVFQSARQDLNSETRLVSAQPDLCFFVAFKPDSEIGAGGTSNQIVSVHFKKTVDS